LKIQNKTKQKEETIKIKRLWLRLWGPSLTTVRDSQAFSWLSGPRRTD